jgi:hypothetical protein
MTGRPDPSASEPASPPGATVRESGGSGEGWPARWFAAAIVVVFYLGAWLLLTPTLRKCGLDFRPLAHMIFACVLLIAGGASLAYLARARRLDHGEWSAVAVALVGPLEIQLVLTGLCASVRP